jgi:hypothetical protein
MLPTSHPRSERGVALQSYRQIQIFRIAIVALLAAVLFVSGIYAFETCIRMLMAAELARAFLACFASVVLLTFAISFMCEVTETWDAIRSEPAI